jgi:hypothetical protein
MVRAQEENPPFYVSHFHATEAWEGRAILSGILSIFWALVILGVPYF